MTEIETELVNMLTRSRIDVDFVLRMIEQGETKLAMATMVSLNEALQALVDKQEEIMELRQEKADDFTRDEKEELREAQSEYISDHYD